MREKEIVLVRFILPNAPYMAGETAGFPPEVAQRFIDRKRTVLANPPEEAAAPPAAAPKAKAKPKAKKKPASKATKK